MSGYHPRNISELVTYGISAITLCTIVGATSGYVISKDKLAGIKAYQLGALGGAALGITETLLQARRMRRHDD